MVFDHFAWRADTQVRPYAFFLIFSHPVNPVHPVKSSFLIIDEKDMLYVI
jgi:hypothetical protein